MKGFALLAAAAAAIGCVAPAAAATYIQYDLVYAGTGAVYDYGTGQPSNAFSFQETEYFNFVVPDQYTIHGSFPSAGVTSTTLSSSYDIQLNYASLSAKGVTDPNTGYADFETGTATGTYFLHNGSTGRTYIERTGTLIAAHTYVSDTPFTRVLGVDGFPNMTIGLPEPSTWAMLLIGFGAIGGSMRIRRRLLVA
jgi:hypothetical protein